MKNILVATVIFLSIGCKHNNNPCVVKAAGLYKTDSGKLFVVDKLNKIMRDKGKDSIKGGEYEFYQNEVIKSYKFYQSMNAFTYSEEYDSTGKITKKEGSPMLYVNIKEIGLDSANFSLYFFALNRIYTQAYISINNKRKVSLIPTPDTLFSNMSIISHGVNTGDLNEFSLFVQAEYFDLCNSSSGVIYDTIKLRAKPILNLVDR